MPETKATASQMSEVPLRYGVLLFPQFEVLDVFGPLEALNTIVRLENFPHRDKLSLEVLAKDFQPVSSGPINPANKKSFNPKVAQSITPTHTLKEAPDIDVLLVPGGYGTGPKTETGAVPDVSTEIEYIESTFPKLQYLISTSSTL